MQYAATLTTVHGEVCPVRQSDLIRCGVMTFFEVVDQRVQIEESSLEVARLQNTNLDPLVVHLASKHTHTHTRTRTHARTHAHTHTHT